MPARSGRPKANRFEVRPGRISSRLKGCLKPECPDGFRLCSRRHFLTEKGGWAQEGITSRRTRGRRPSPRAEVQPDAPRGRPRGVVTQVTSGRGVALARRGVACLGRGLWPRPLPHPQPQLPPDRGSPTRVQRAVALPPTLDLAMASPLTLLLALCCQLHSLAGGPRWRRPWTAQHPSRRPNVRQAAGAWRQNQGTHSLPHAVAALPAPGVE